MQKEWAETADILTGTVIDVNSRNHIILEVNGFNFNPEVAPSEIEHRFVTKEYWDDYVQRSKELLIGKEVFIEMDYPYNRMNKIEPDYIGVIWLKNPREIEDRISKKNVEKYMFNAMMVSEGYFTLNGEARGEYQYSFSKLRNEALEDGKVKW